MKFGLILAVVWLIAVTESKREPKFAPYIDVTRAAEFDLVHYMQTLGVKAFTLAFALGGNAGCSPTWAGQSPIEDANIINKIKAFKAAGGDVIISSGGALGPYLEASCGSASALAAAYKKVLSVTGSTHIDIDIEAAIGVDNMNEALAMLQKENSAITVSYTLMVQGDDYGITDELGVNVLKSAVNKGVNVDIVNPMTMDFGSSKDWGDAVISAAEATHKQMKGVWPQKSDAELYSMLGVTPMLGVNDNQKLFSLDHAKKLVNWAKQKQIGHLAFWSMGRDKGCAGKPVSPACSSISESDYEFTKIFVAFDDGKVSPTDKPTDEPVTDHTTQGHTQTTHKSTGTTPKTTGTTHKTGISTPKTVDVDCSKEDSRWPDPKDCTKFIHCYGGQAHEEQCGPGEVWNTGAGLCDFPQNANRPECQ